MELPVKSATIHLDGEYAGVSLTLRTNPPIRIFDELSSGDLDRILVGLSAVTLASNLDDVDLSTPNGWRSMPTDVIQQAVEKFTNAITQVDPLTKSASASGSGGAAAAKSPRSTKPSKSAKN